MIAQAHGIPEELNVNDWFITIVEPDPDKEGNTTKRPYKCKPKEKPETRRDYETVINEIYRLPDHNNLLPAIYLDHRNKLWCVDLDNHENDPEKSALNSKIVELAKTYDLYITVSCSETGFHIFGLFDAVEQKSLYKNYQKKIGKFEFYCNVHYICENAVVDPINVPEKIKSGTEFLYKLKEFDPNIDIWANIKSSTPTTTEAKDTKAEQTEQASTSNDNEKPAKIQDTTSNNNDTTLLVTASDLTAEQVVKVILKHRDDKTRSRIENIFNGILTNPSEDLQALYNVVYYWTPDFEVFKGVVKEATALYNHYVNMCNKERKDLWTEINRKLKKENLSSEGHLSYLRFDKNTGEFIGFGKPKTELVVKEAQLTVIPEARSEKNKTTIEQVKYILQNDPLLQDLVYYNVFTYELIKTKNVLWNNDFKVIATNIEERWNNSDDAGLRFYLEKKYHIYKNKEIIDDAFKIVYEFGNKKHPVKEYLEHLPKWDGVERVPTLLTDYMGAEDTEYTRQVIIKILSACYQRIYHPGCKFDYTCVLVGRQGLGKSSLINALAVNGKYFGSISSSIEFDKGTEKITGKWIVEFDELASFKKSGVETIKAFITTRKDIYRVPYEKRPEDRPRQTVFFGTTNNTLFLMDTTGNRRFWIVECGKQPPTKNWQNITEDDVNQIWAEVKANYSDCILYLSPELEAQANQKQSEHYSDYVYKPQIEKYVNMLVPVTAWDYEYTLIQRKDYFEKYTDYSKEYKKHEADGTLKDYKMIDCITPLMIWQEVIPHNENKELDNKTKKEIMDCLLSFDELELCHQKKGKPLKLYQRPTKYITRKSK